MKVIVFLIVFAISFTRMKCIDDVCGPTSFIGVDTWSLVAFITNLFGAPFYAYVAVWVAVSYIFSCVVVLIINAIKSRVTKKTK
mgnify:CR=1 FL=1